MADSGWLGFGPPRKTSAQAKAAGYAPIIKPPFGQQKASVGPQFGRLRKALDQRRLQVADPDGESDPELIVVFVLAQPVVDFRRAAEAAGIEYLAQIEADDLPTDSGFTTADGKPVAAFAHGIVTNSAAADELIRCFNAWQKNQKVKLPRGLAPLKEVFQTLHTIRRWDASDRVRETGLLATWRTSVALAGRSPSPRLVELELWYRTTETARTAAQASVESAVTAGGGTVLAHAVIPDIRYHGVLAEISAQEVESALMTGAGQIRALTVDDVMFAASAEGMTYLSIDNSYKGVSGQPPEPGSLDPPRIALLDGLPHQNHALLRGRVIIDDPQDVASEYPEDSRRHGTAMASLIVFGDLSEGADALREWIYCRPLLRKHPWQDAEVTPRDQLLVDAVHRAVIDMLDGERPAAPSVRIINLSIGCPERTFVRSMSPLARLLDWLSFRYNTLFVVSAGNHTATELEIEGYSPALGSSDLKRAAYAAVHADSRMLGLLSPSEAVNALSVGASHADSSSPPSNDALLELSPLGLPSLYSAQGFGFDRSTKPDLLAPGGRQFYARPTPGSVTARPALPGPGGPGHQVAAPDALHPKRRAFVAGTSNAAALTSRTASLLMRELEESDPALVDAQYFPLASRALVAHMAQWEPAFSELSSLLGLSRKDAAKYLGYGVMSQADVTQPDPHRAVILAADSISDGERHEYQLPIPLSLHGLHDWKRLKMTLAWFTPTNPSTSTYVEAKLNIAIPASRWRWGKRVGVVDDLTLGGTLIQQVVEGERAIAAQLGDSWTIPVEARSSTGRKLDPVRYALVVSVEVASSTLVDIHNEVRVALAAQAAVQVQTRVRP